MKSNIKRLLMVLLVCIMASSFTACGGCNKDVAADNITEPEGTTAVQKMLVTVTDNEGNEKQVEGVAVIDEKGNATITVQDEAGKDIVITGKTTKDENGNATISDITVADNTNVTVSVKPDTKDEETSTQAPTEAPTQASTQVTTEAPTQTPTEAPTQAPTETPTETPTEAPTEAPTNPAANNCPYQLYVITTRYIENGMDGSKEYIGYYYLNGVYDPRRLEVTETMYNNGYINNMWSKVGNYDDYSGVTFAYYWK